MQLPNPFRKFLSSSIPTNSMGIVRRNYHKPAAFNPHRQLTGITYKAIDKIGQTVSVYRPQVSRRNGEMLEQHPLYNLFEKPNPRVNMGNDFVHLWAMLMEIYGESFWYLAKGETSKRVKEIYLLNPAQIELKIDKGELIGYVLHKQNGQHVPLEVDEVMHDKRPNPFNEWRGLSVLEKAAVYVDTEINTSSFTLNYISNSASPSGIVTLPEMTPEAFRQFTHQWREGYEGPENAGKTAFIRGGEANFQAVGATLKDIDQKVTRDMAKEDVLMMLDMPKSMLGMTDDKGLGRASVETMKYIYAESKLEPMMRRLDSIYQQLLPMVAAGEGYTITHESPIPEDKEYRHTVHKDLVNVAMTVNEVREDLGLPPLPDGDVLASNRPPVEAPAAKSIKVVAKKKLSKAEQLKNKNLEQEKFRKELIATSDVYATKIKSEISKLAGKQESAIIDKLSASTKAYEEWLFNVKEESVAMANVIVPIIIELMEEQAGAVQHWLTGELLTISPEMRKTVEANITKIAGVFNEETIKALERSISEGVTNGENLVKLKKRVETVYSDAKGYRAERIARTEGLKASNMAAEYSYKNAGYSTVEWFVNPGACEFCLSLSGRTKEIGSQFLKQGEVLVGTDGNQLKIEYDDVGTPPAHPNCVIGDTVVVSPDAEKLIKSHYSGDVVNIKTTQGRELTVTPNHVVLTDRGWVAAKLLRKGDNVISESVTNGVSVARPTQNDSPATIANVFDSIRKSSGVTTSAVPVSTEYLKGDALFSKGNIDIVSANGFLRDNVEITEQLHSFFFIDGHDAVSGLSGLSDFTSMLIALGASSDGSVSLSDIAKLFSLSSFGHDDLARFFNVSSYNSRLSQASGDSRPTYTEPYTKTLNTLASVVSSDEIVSVEFNSFHGDVYDVSSKSTLYSANGLITSNCTCSLVPGVE